MADSELELAQLLCTRLCHDLAGPVGAVAAGVELIGSDPAAADEETLSLIGNSSVAASLKLKFMRAALGSANGAGADLAALLDGYLDATASAGGKPKVSWPATLSEASGIAGPSWRQAILNLCLSALELQPGCRELAVSVSSEEAAITIMAKGTSRGSTLRADLEAALAGTAPALSAKTIQAYFTGSIIRSAGGAASARSVDGGIAIDARFKRGA